MLAKLKLFLTISFLYLILTCIVFFPRLWAIQTEYSVSGLDTDSAIWTYERDFSKNWTIPNPDVDNYWWYPFWYKWTKLPYTYWLPVNIIHSIYKRSWENFRILMLFVNINTIIPYFFTCLIGFYFFSLFCRRKYIAFLAWALLGFTYYWLNFASGSLLNSHIRAIYLPFYLIALFCTFLLQNKKKESRLILAIVGLVFWVVFWINFYYWFFSLFFSPIIFLIILKTKIKDFFKEIILFYCFSVIWVIIINLNYFIANIAFVYSSTSAMSEVGRVAKDFSPINEMLPSVFPFFVEHRGDNMDWHPYHAFSIWYLLLIVFFLGFFNKKFLKKNILLYAAILFSIILYSYVPFFFFINNLYFLFFGTFKWVLRFMLITNFLSIWLFAEYVSSYLEKYIKFKKYIYLLLWIFVFIQVYRNIPFQQKLWSHRTDFTDIKSLYSLLKDPQIKTIASYPMYLENNLIKDIWWVPNYQLLGQMIHHKPLAWSVDINAENLTWMIAYFNSIKNIEDSNIVDSLSKYGINTIVLYNSLLKRDGIDVDRLHKKFKQNSRLIYLGGKKIMPDDEDYITIKDLSMDISIFVIKDVKVPPLLSLVCETSWKVLSWKNLGYNMYIYDKGEFSSCKDIYYYSASDVAWKLKLFDSYPSILDVLRHGNETLFKRVSTQFFNKWNISSELSKNRGKYVVLYNSDLKKYIYCYYLSIFLVVLNLFYFLYIIILDKKIIKPFKRDV